MTDNEKLEDSRNKRKRLIFRSWHRGTREMDLIMGSFANAHVEGMTAEELDLYEELLHNPDPDLYDWITGREAVPKKHQSPIMSKLLEHQHAANRKTGSDDR